MRIFSAKQEGKKEKYKPHVDALHERKRVAQMVFGELANVVPQKEHQTASFLIEASTLTCLNSDGTVWQYQIDEEQIIICQKKIFKITGKTSKIWELIDGRRTVAQIAVIICGYSLADPIKCISDVSRMFDLLWVKGLITYR